MLNIAITGITGTPPNIGLRMDGNGYNIAYEFPDVQWQVLGGTPVSRIEAITLKNISGSTNPFLPGYPRPLTTDKKIWVARGNRVTAESIYVYKINWVDNHGGAHDFDPIISIRPRSLALKPLEIILGVFTLVGFIFSGFMFWRMKRMELKNKK